jgi:hypothetical protein
MRFAKKHNMIEKKKLSDRDFNVLCKLIANAKKAGWEVDSLWSEQVWTFWRYRTWYCCWVIRKQDTKINFRLGPVTELEDGDL